MATVALEPAKVGRAASRTALLFTLCFILAQADKQVMGLLALPVQAAFQLTDVQLGILQGGAFAIAFAIGGLPIARLLDGGHRVRIASACVALWSVATIFCGLAGSFTILVAFRAATAVAEAGLPPAALSIFSQCGDRRLTARLTSTFMLGPFIGGGLVLLLGGMLINAIAEGTVTLPGLSEPWRIVFLAVGLPGLLLAPLLALFGREPARPSITMRQTPIPTYRDVLRAIFVEHPFLRFYYLGLTALYLYVAAQIAWYPAFLARELGLSVAAAGAHAGLTYLTAGVTGTLCATALASFRRRLGVSALVRDTLVAAITLVPVSLMLSLTDSIAWSLALYAAHAFVSAAVIAFMTVPIQLSLDSDIQSRGLAIFSLFMSVIAGSAGPFVVGLISDQANVSLGTALALTGVCSTTVASILLYLAGHAARASETVD